MRGLYSGGFQIATLPNLLSIIRLFLVLPLYPFLKDSRVFLTTLFLILIVLTDILDGYFARKFHLENPVGKILDHGVDKVVSMSISYIFYKFSFLPVWAFWFFFLRDLLILLVGGVLYFGFRVALGSLWLGKIAGIFYFGMFFALLLGFEHFGKLLMIISVFLFTVVVIVYPIKFYPSLKIKIFGSDGGVA